MTSQSLTSRQQKSFPEAERHHFYVDLHKEVKAAHKAAHKFNEMKPTLAAKGVKVNDVELALEGQMIAIIAMFDICKAVDPVSFLLRLTVFSTDDCHTRNTRSTAHTSKSPSRKPCKAQLTPTLRNDGFDEHTSIGLYSRITV